MCIQMMLPCLSDLLNPSLCLLQTDVASSKYDVMFSVTRPAKCLCLVGGEKLKSRFFFHHQSLTALAFDE